MRTTTTTAAVTRYGLNLPIREAGFPVASPSFAGRPLPDTEDACDRPEAFAVLSTYHEKLSPVSDKSRQKDNSHGAPVSPTVSYQTMIQRHCITLTKETSEAITAEVRRGRWKDLSAAVQFACAEVFGPPSSNPQSAIRNPQSPKPESPPSARPPSPDSAPRIGAPEARPLPPAKTPSPRPSPAPDRIAAGSKPLPKPR